MVELRQTMEMYKTAADRFGRASQSCCLSLALESLERCDRLLHLALMISPPEDVVREQALGKVVALGGAAPRSGSE
jgi:hypothetical protein